MSTRLRVGLVLADSQFESEAQAFLQGRLRLFYGVTLALAGFFYLASVFVGGLATGGFDWLGTDKIVHLGSMAVIGGILGVLGRGALRAGMLLVLDAVGFYVSVATGLAIYALNYSYALPSMPGIIGLFLIARAVVVPCSGLGTFLMSLPAPLGLLAIQLVYGTAYVDRGVQVMPERFVATLVWNQVVMGAAVGIATLASHMSRRLRSQAAEARRLGQYQLDESLGAGAMGEVYRAHHAMLRRPTAVKLLRPEITGEETIQRFEREVRETSMLTHPNTIRIYDYGRTPDGLFYYAMELLDGIDLGHCVKQFGPMPAARVIHIMSQACGALKEAHNQGLVHRDIKGGNLMLVRRAGEHDVVKVVDFGLVKDLRATDSALTQVGTVCGTPETMAPEIVLGREASPQSDLYSLGVVGYYLLTGVSVFDVEAPMQFLTKHMSEEPPPPSKRADVPADLEAVILRCLRKEPKDRFAGAGDLRAALARCQDARLWTETNAKLWWEQHSPRFRRSADGA
ncbi:MAG: serine/threonine protein kinase [Planctomycetota bacterium]|nr:serine/threonine protein kinase [Planctomycetota bacterium]